MDELTKKYLTAGAEMYIDGAEGTLGENGVIVFDNWADKAPMYFEGEIVEIDDNGKMFIYID